MVYSLVELCLFKPSSYAVNQYVYELQSALTDIFPKGRSNNSFFRKYLLKNEPLLKALTLKRVQI